MSHVTLNDYRDLQRYGLNCLTGEACAYTYRVLFDLSEEGAALVRNYLGLAPGAIFLDNWNSMVGTAPAVGSVMLSHAVVKDLMVFALLSVGNFDRVLQTVNGTIGFNLDDRMCALFLKYAKEWPQETTRLHHNCRKGGNQPHIGDRNIHQATGRTE
jgi:hypothetical protein